MDEKWNPELEHWRKCRIAIGKEATKLDFKYKKKLIYFTFRWRRVDGIAGATYEIRVVWEFGCRDRKFVRWNVVKNLVHCLCDSRFGRARNSVQTSSKKSPARRIRRWAALDDDVSDQRFLVLKNYYVFNDHQCRRCEKPNGHGATGNPHSSGTNCCERSQLCDQQFHSITAASIPSFRCWLRFHAPNPNFDGEKSGEMFAGPLGIIKCKWKIFSN